MRHVCHALHLVYSTVQALVRARVVVCGVLGAALELTASVCHIDHALLLVLVAILAGRAIGQVEARRDSAAGLCTLLVAQVDHACTTICNLRGCAI